MAADTDSTVFILIEDEDISLLFSELLQARGSKTILVSSSEKIPETAKVLTEPKYYNGLLPEQKACSLVVGSKTALETIPTAKLSRPLTEEKIEAALKNLL